MITVVIPCYNRSALVKRAVESVLQQTTPASQIVVVDDGSTDDTKAVCAAFGTRVEYVWQKNAGASIARNTGVEKARNSWVAFLDSDDYWTPAHLANLTNAIKETKGEARFYFCDMQMGTKPEAITLWKMIGFQPQAPFQMAKDGTNWMFLNRQPTMLQCAVFRKEDWLQCGGLDARYRLMHDTELFFKLGVGGKVCAVAGAGCVQTEDDVSSVRLTTAVHGKQTAYWEEAVLLWEELLRQFPNMPARYRKVTRHYAASARWRLFRLHWSAKNPGKGAMHLPMMGLADPKFTFSLLAHRDAEHLRPVISPEYD